MTDYFALLGQPRRPWIDAEKLKQAFHQKTLQAHPDAQRANGDSGEAEAAFAAINDAYQVLQDPKRRLQHLLALHGDTGKSSAAVAPADLEELFPQIAALTQELARTSEQAAAATSALGRSLLKPQLLQVRQRLSDMLELLLSWKANADAALQEIDNEWTNEGGEQLPRLRELYVRYSYLQRWIGQLEEHRMQLPAE